MLEDLKSAIRPAVMLPFLFAILLGFAYPAVLTGIGQIVFPFQANGSLIRENGRVIGSDLIGQGFARDGYFHPRPSAAGTGYDAANSYGSNLGPTSQVLHDRVKTDAETLRKTSQTTPDVPLPADLVTTSASGLDPHLSPEAALFQVDRIAAARLLPPDAVRRLVTEHEEGALLGFIGEPRVNVLALNRALDRLAQKGARTAE